MSAPRSEPRSRSRALSRLYAIVDVDVSERAGWAPLGLTRALLDGGVRLLQLRAKSLAGAALLDLASSIVALARPYDAVVIVNDRLDIARLADADGAHLGQDDVPPAMARRVLRGSSIVGWSTHTVGQLEAAAVEPVDYVAIGPVFGTATKATGYEAVGLEMVRRAVTVGKPVVGIGGITLENAASVIAAGAASVAVISDLVATGNPTLRARELLQRLG